MTNITLSIEDKVYKKMRKYSEIKWSEYVRKIIERRVTELEKLDSTEDEESIFTMLTSEDVLKKDWDNDYDKKWDTV